MKGILVVEFFPKNEKGKGVFMEMPLVSLKLALCMNSNDSNSLYLCSLFKKKFLKALKKIK